MATAGIESERPAAPDLYRKLVLLTGIRLLVGTALLVATAVLSLGRDAFPSGVEAYLYCIIAGLYVASLISVVLLCSVSRESSSSPTAVTAVPMIGKIR